MRHKAIRRPFTDNETGPAPNCDGIVILDGSLSPIALDAGAEAILEHLNSERGGSRNSVLPPVILQLLDSRSGRDPDAPHMHVSAGGHEYTCRAFAMKPRTGAQPMLALYLRREVSVADALDQVAAEYRLTDREREALIGISMGLTSKELAVRMNISPNTVKAFLRLIMIKMGTSTRAGIVAKVLDQNGRRMEL
jgi:DNA-binding CsgD family transcriptional regulator